MKKSTQDAAVLLHLKEHGAINPKQALELIGCFRLSAVIHRLRKLGHKIETKRINKHGRFGKVNFAEYHLKTDG